MKRVSLELGGKSPNIVFPDADQPLAVRNAMNGVFYNSGQVCAAGTRIFVQRDIYDNFVADLTTASERMTLGIHSIPRPGSAPSFRASSSIRSRTYSDVKRPVDCSLIHSDIYYGQNYLCPL